MFAPSSWTRLWARLVDGFVVSFMLWPALGTEAWSGLPTGHLRFPWPLLIYFLAVPWLYETVSLWLFGRTLGKWIFLLKVVPAFAANRPLSFVEAATRALSDQLAFFVGWSLFAVGLLRFDRRHVADLLAGTRVVSARRRKYPARIRWAWALVLVFTFGPGSWDEARQSVRTFAVDAAGAQFAVP